jgi:hypothetical protein
MAANIGQTEVKTVSTEIAGCVSIAGRILEVLGVVEENEKELSNKPNSSKIDAQMSCLEVTRKRLNSILDIVIKI